MNSARWCPAAWCTARTKSASNCVWWQAQADRQSDMRLEHWIGGSAQQWWCIMTSRDRFRRTAANLHGLQCCMVGAGKIVWGDCAGQHNTLHIKLRFSPCKYKPTTIQKGCYGHLKYAETFTVFPIWMTLNTQHAWWLCACLYIACVRALPQSSDTHADKRSRTRMHGCMCTRACAGGPALTMSGLETPRSHQSRPSDALTTPSMRYSLLSFKNGKESGSSKPYSSTKLSFVTPSTLSTPGKLENLVSSTRISTCRGRRQHENTVRARVDGPWAWQQHRLRINSIVASKRRQHTHTALPSSEH